jgi:hypothetical protein
MMDAGEGMSRSKSQMEKNMSSFVGTFRMGIYMDIQILCSKFFIILVNRFKEWGRG